MVTRGCTTLMKWVVFTPFPCGWTTTLDEWNTLMKYIVFTPVPSMKLCLFNSCPCTGSVPWSFTNSYWYRMFLFSFLVQNATARNWIAAESCFPTKPTPKVQTKTTTRTLISRCTIYLPVAARLYLMLKWHALYFSNQAELLPSQVNRNNQNTELSVLPTVTSLNH